MIAWVCVYGKDTEEKPDTIVLRVRDLGHAKECVPQVLAHHRHTCGTGCLVDHWTISAKPNERATLKIVAAGEFDHA